MSIITSLLDLDLYKLTMMQVVYHQFKNMNVRYKFVCRGGEQQNKDLRFFNHDILEEIKNLNGLKFTQDEINYLSTLKFFKSDFIDYLKNFKLDINNVFIWTDNNHLNIEIKGKWIDTILFETLILSIICEVYNKMRYPHPDMIGAVERFDGKIRAIKDLKNFRLLEFGTRRRFSKNLQEKAIERFVISGFKLNGTSNVMFAKQFNLTPRGTMAHEFIQAFQGDLRYQLKDSQKAALDSWVQEYRGDLGIALTDTLGIDVFLRDFDMYFAKLFDGVRQDSGDPDMWTEKILNHYRKMNIDPKSKFAIYSDNLTISKAIDLYTKYEPYINTVFGIGTHLTNDIPGVQPLNIVIKMVECSGCPVAKISDSPGKTICEDESYLQRLRTELGIT